MTSNIDIAVKNAFNEFLRRACEIAHGDTKKSIKVSEIWDDNFSIKGIDRETYIPQIVDLLKKNHHFIQDGNSKDEIRLTYEGIYYVVDKFRISPENFGVLSHADLNKYLPRFVDIVYKKTRGDTNRVLNINDIKKEGLGGLGDGSLQQIRESLMEKGLIESGLNENQIKLPSNQIKKSYDAPEKRREPYSLT